MKDDQVVFEFPCRYPIKIIAAASAEAIARVVEVVRAHSPEVTPDDIGTRHSRESKFVSIRVNLMARDAAQLERLYSELMAHEAVRLII